MPNHEPSQQPQADLLGRAPTPKELRHRIKPYEIVYERDYEETVEEQARSWPPQGWRSQQWPSDYSDAAVAAWMKRIRQEWEEHRALHPPAAQMIRSNYLHNAGLLQLAGAKLPADYEGFLPDLDEQADKSSDQAANEKLGPARHSADFRSVHWYGADYTFTEAQAKVVAQLWQAWENRTPEVGNYHLLQTAILDNDRLPDVFKSKGQYHLAWGTMIVVGSTKASYRLEAPSGS
ncbi:MAG TPA: hypothetical protein VKE94_04075 [Gemmataceae bacterium]|nr:hypothetical protein [Gemmataceae bacterium]